MKRVYSSKITIFFSFFCIVIFSAILIFSTVELISGALQGKMNIVFVGLVVIIGCIGFIFLSAITLNRCGYKVIYDRENNIIYREGFICGYKCHVNVDDIKEIIIAPFPREDTYYVLVDSVNKRYDGGFKDSFIRIEKTERNREFIKQFWNKPIEEYKDYDWQTKI